jgi:hypothetical protein
MEGLQFGSGGEEWTAVLVEIEELLAHILSELDTTEKDADEYAFFGTVQEAQEYSPVDEPGIFDLLRNEV